VNSEAQNGGMTLIVKTVTRLTFGLILLFGLYIAAHGHLSPGGGFAGGVIMALAFTHLMLAFGSETALRKLSKNAASFLEGLGGLVFVGVAMLGFIAGPFFRNMLPKGEPFSLFSAGTIPIYNLAAIMVKVGAGLFSAVLALVLFMPNLKGDK